MIVGSLGSAVLPRPSPPFHIMLGLCTHPLASLKLDHGITRSVPSSLASLWSTGTRIVRSGTLASNSSRSTALNSRLVMSNRSLSSLEKRSYVTSRKKSSLTGANGDGKPTETSKANLDHRSLENFFDADQQVGETRLVQRKPKNQDLDGEEELQPEMLSEVEELRLMEESLRERLDTSESELDMAMGLSSFRPADRKARYKPAKTVAMEKLQAQGFSTLFDLSDMDYDSLVRSIVSCSPIQILCAFHILPTCMVFADSSLTLCFRCSWQKSFALQHEIKVEDFFTKNHTDAGEISELRVPIERPGADEFGGVREGLIEHSREYLRTSRASPKNFRDRIRVRCMAGGGGKGGVSFYRDTRVHKGPPDGGDGGEGGSVIFMAAENKKPSLASLQPSYRGGQGMPGSRTRRKGKSGADVVIEVPLGTTITEFRSKAKDEFGDDLVPQHHSSAKDGDEHEDGDAMSGASPRSQVEMFMDSNQASIEKESYEEELTDEDVEESGLSPETRLWRQEQKHRKLYADPRAGRAWAPPTLPEHHPLQQSASEFHKIISQYENMAKTMGETPIGSLLRQPSVDAPPPHLMSSSTESSSGIAKTKKNKKPSLMQPGYEEYYDEEMAYGEQEEFVSGSDLVEKYRMKGPSETPIKASNAPRKVELDEPGAYFVAAKGGAGGLGNWRLAAVRNRPQAIGTPGKPGESLIYQLELKLIADVGLVGFPNAGKSTFLSNVSRANPKIASYPFTTLCPEIGTVQLEDDTQFTIADLPGLIEGAHANRGLGHQFLKHVERTSALVFVIDMSGGDKRDPWKSFLTLWDELERYQKGLAKKPSIIVANKMDVGTVSHQNLRTFSKHLKAEKEFKNLKIYPISASSKMNMTSVISALRRLLGFSDPLPSTERSRNFTKRVSEARESGIVTINIASHFSEALKNVK